MSFKIKPTAHSSCFKLVYLIKISENILLWKIVIKFFPRGKH